MANPLASTGSSAGGGDLPPGSTRIIEARDKQGNLLKTFTLYRTDREYVYDLCDAYNAGLTKAQRATGLQWFVTPGGELKLGDDAEWSRANHRRIESTRETERARFVRKQLEHPDYDA